MLAEKMHTLFFKKMFIRKWASKTLRKWNSPDSNAWAALFKNADFS